MAGQRVPQSRGYNIGSALHMIHTAMISRQGQTNNYCFDVAEYNYVVTITCSLTVMNISVDWFAVMLFLLLHSVAKFTCYIRII